MLSRIRVLVLFGGASSEHEVSCMSACSIINNLDRDRFSVYTVGITKGGSWFLTDSEPQAIKSGEWEKNASNSPAVLSPDRGHRGLLVLKNAGYELLPVDVIFPVLHGKNGEDGTVQGLFELSGLPYVGCGVLSSAACMDKEFTHAMLTGAGIRNAKFICVKRSEGGDPAAITARLNKAGISYPVFVKPANAGSSVGISKAHSEAELPVALRVAFTEDSKAILEETLLGLEVECAVMGNGEPVASGAIGEIEPLRELYDYDGKYCDETTKLHIPARVSNDLAERVRETAVLAYRALGCMGLSRVDFFILKGTGEVVLNEINTLPGFTDISMFPKLFMNDGLSYAELLERLIELALNNGGAR